MPGACTVKCLIFEGLSMELTNNMKIAGMVLHSFLSADTKPLIN